MRIGRAVGHGDDDNGIRIMAVGAKSFRPIENPDVSTPLRGHAGAAGVRSGRWLGQTPGAKKLAGGKFAYVFFLLCVVSGEKDVIRTQRGVRGDDDAHRTIYARQLFDGSGVLHVTHARAAVLRRKNHT